MNKTQHRNHTLLWLSVIFTLVITWFILPAAGASINTNDIYFNALKQQLIIDGFDQAWIDKIYGHAETQFDVDSATIYFKHKESRLNYDQFATKRSIRRARKYIQKHAATFQATEKKFGVKREVITAIILVESQFGSLKGKRSVLNTLSTLASLSDPDVRQRLWTKIPKADRIPRQKYEKKAIRKSKWAYAELKAFLEYAKKENVLPWGVFGSFAGAMGIPQFMPSNVLAYAKDGNNDGTVDLFEHADAIASVASYLKRFGWKPGIDREKAYEIIFRYNHSDPYVKTILKISDMLEG